MNNQKLPGTNLSRWILLLIIGLILESCILAAIAGIFLARRGDISLPMVGQVAALPSATADLPLEPTLTAYSSSVSTLITTPTDNGGIVPSEVLTEVPVETETPQVTPTVWEFPPTGRIVYTCFDGAYDQICIMNSDGSEQKQLTDIAATNFYPSLSATGDRIFFSSNRDGNFEIYRMNTDGRDLKQLTDDLGNLYAPELSPNSNRILFTHESGGQQDIWIMRADGNNARPLTDSGSDIDPTWSPNGEQIAFTSARDGVKQIFIMNANGGKPRPVAIPESPKIGGRLSWSPDGDWLAFYGGPSGDRNIYIVSLNGKALLQLTQGGDNLGPAYSPDGVWIAFTSFRNGNNEIYVMHADGTNQARLTTDRNSDWQPRWER